MLRRHPCHSQSLQFSRSTWWLLMRALRSPLQAGCTLITLENSSFWLKDSREEGWMLPKPRTHLSYFKSQMAGSHGRETSAKDFFQKFPYNPFKVYYSSTVVGCWSSKASLSLVTLNYIKIAHPHTHASRRRHTVPSCKKKKEKKRLRHHHHFFVSICLAFSPK